MGGCNRRFQLTLTFIFALGVTLSVGSAPAPPLKSAATRTLSQMPVYFVANQGQAELSEAAYFVQGRATTVYFTPQGVVYRLRNRSPFQPAALGAHAESVVRQEFLNAALSPRVEGRQLTSARMSYFLGPQENWVTGVPSFAEVLYPDLWEGIDLSFTGPAGNLKYTFTVRPGADPSRIAFSYRGATRVSLTGKGSLRVETAAGGFTDDAPVAWQDTEAGRVPVSVAFRLDGEQVRFAVGDYDRSRELILDPVVVVYSGFLGGTLADYSDGIAIDGAGNVYLALHTDNGLAIVNKVSADGTSLLYSATLGGGRAYGVAVDAAGHAYVAGAASAAFPTTIGAYSTTHSGGAYDVFVVKMNPAGTGLIYSTYVGGSNEDVAYGIVIDSAGNAYVAGDTQSANFPLTAGAAGGARDSFAFKLNPTATALVYSMRVGGSGNENARGIALDSGLNAYVAGYTASNNFPTTVGPDLTWNGGSFDVFIYKVNAAGTALAYAGYIGGATLDFGMGVAVDSGGNAYVVGHTHSSSSYPTTPGAFDTTHNGGGTDMFVTKVNPTGTALVYSTFLGGTSSDSGGGIAVDAAGNAYIVGDSYSADFPVNGEGADTSLNGGSDIVYLKLNSTGSAVLYSGFLGGSANDYGRAITIDATGAAYLTGHAFSTEASFPVIVGPDLTANGSADAFVAKISAHPATAGPLIAFRNGFNAIETQTFPSTLLRNAGGNFRLNPAIAKSASGRVFLVARDSSVGLWLNFLKPDNLFNGWLFAGGNSPGNPDIAVSGETAWIVFRDPWSSYWVRSYTPGAGFGTATWLQGILATVPKIAGCPNGDLYIVGRDNFNGLWTRRYQASTTTWQVWRFAGGITQGTPGIACGSDNAAYIAVRDNSNNMWLARVFQESAPTWSYGAGIWDGDLQVAAGGTRIYVVGLSYFTPFYRVWEVGTGWTSPLTSPGGTLTHLSPAVYGDHLFLSGQDAAGNIWWWSQLGNAFTNFGLRNVAASSQFSSAAR